MESRHPLQTLAHPPTPKKKKNIVGVFQQNHNHYNLDAPRVFRSRHDPPSQSQLRPVSSTMSSYAAINNEKRFVAITITKLSSTAWSATAPSSISDSTPNAESRAPAA